MFAQMCDDIFECRRTVTGKLKRGKLYRGRFEYSLTIARSGTYWRIRVTDERGISRPFDPSVFTPVKERKTNGRDDLQCPDL